METIRRRVVAVAYRNCPDLLAVIIAKVSRAVPDVFCALAAVVGGSSLVFPATALLLGLTMTSFTPIIRTLVRDGFSWNSFLQGNEEAGAKAIRRVEEKLVPAVFVAMTVDAICSAVVGIATENPERLFHAAAIAVPGVLVSFLEMCRTAECPCAYLTQRELLGRSV
jgi:hypothetical protein